MTDKQILAKAKKELAFYQQVKKDGITMKESLEFWKEVVGALQFINYLRGDKE